MGERRCIMASLRYYCQGQGTPEVRRLLAEIRTKHNISYEVLDLSSNGARDEEREKQVYEAEFKPRAKLLKKRTGNPIARLRSRRGRYYGVSTPGTIAVVGDGKVEWYAVGDSDIVEFLKVVLVKGPVLLEERSR
jgi:hypothetical protein